MSAPREVDRLDHVIDACDRISRYTASGPASLQDERTYDAVLHCLTVIGEALGGLSDETYALLTSVPRNLPKAQRNLIVHQYWRIDVATIWDTVAVAVPALHADATAVGALLAPSPDS